MFKLETVGSDPEFFLFSEDNAFPAIRFTSGTKTVPEEIKPGFSLQRDNLLIEGNIPPSRTKDEFVSNILFIKDYIRSRVEIKSLKLVCADSARFMPRYLRIPEAREFGCDPYKLAWRGGKTAEADDLSRISERVAGFHIHLGYDWEELPKNRADVCIAKAFDMFVTVPSREIHSDRTRMRYYGRLGSYRGKSYGIECRSLGGYFLNDEYLPWVWDRIQDMSKYLNTISKEALNKLSTLGLTFAQANYANITGLLDDSVYEKYEVKKLEKIYVSI